MIDSVRHTLRSFSMVEPFEPLWVGVSGGVDSMVLLDVLLKLGHPCHVVHVHHGLRGVESDADRDLVVDHCTRHGIPCRVEHVDVKARTGGGRSVQMAARTLRLDVFRRLVKEGPHKLALAHHADDVAETFFMHLLRGAGVRGWRAIPPVVGPVVRPLIEVPRSAIADHARRNAIPYREDASNREPKYLRNRVRQELMPVFWSMRAGSQDVMARNMRHLRELTALAEREVAAFTSQQDLGAPLFLSKDALLATVAPYTVLHALLAPRGFHPDQISDLFDALRASHVGARSNSHDQVAVVERDGIAIGPVPAAPRQWMIPDGSAWQGDVPIRVRECRPGEVDLGEGSWVAWMDGEALRYPLVVRPWKAGDRMRPLGLSGSKLISDLLTDAKVSAEQRPNAMVLEGPDGILWIPGLRVAEMTKVHGGAERIVRLEWKGARIFNR